MPNAELVDLSCGGCFASVQETNHGGAFDSFRLNYDGTLSAPIVNGTNYTVEAVQLALQGATEVQTVSLTGYDTDGDSYTLNYEGADTVPITRGQNNTAPGIAAALQGGNEQQQVTLTGFNAATAGHSFQVQIGGNNSAVLGNGGLAIIECERRGRGQRDPGLRRNRDVGRRRERRLHADLRRALREHRRPRDLDREPGLRPGLLVGSP